MTEHNRETFRCIPGGRVLLYKYHCVFRREYGSCKEDCKYIPKGLNSINQTNSKPNNGRKRRKTK